MFDFEPDGVDGSRVSYALEWEVLTLVGRLFGARPRRGGERVLSTCRRPICPRVRERALPRYFRIGFYRVFPVSLPGRRAVSSNLSISH